MHICSLWFDLEVHSLLNEKLIQERCTGSVISKSVLCRFVDVSYDFVSLRFSYSLSTDWSMLYYAIVSIFKYLNRSDILTCRRYNQNFSVLVDIAFAGNQLSNKLFHLLFMLCIFTQDSSTDMDCVYQFWTHGRLACTTNNSALFFSRRNIAFDSVYCCYFFNKFDANLLYSIGIDVFMRQKNSLLAYLLCSLYSVSFVNTNLQHSLSFLHG